MVTVAAVLFVPAVVGSRLITTYPHPRGVAGPQNERGRGNVPEFSPIPLGPPSVEFAVAVIAVATPLAAAFAKVAAIVWRRRRRGAVATLPTAVAPAPLRKRIGSGKKEGKNKNKRPNHPYLLSRKVGLVHTKTLDTFCPCVPPPMMDIGCPSWAGEAWETAYADDFHFMPSCTMRMFASIRKCATSSAIMLAHARRRTYSL